MSLHPILCKILGHTPTPHYFKALSKSISYTGQNSLKCWPHGDHKVTSPEYTVQAYRVRNYS